MPFPSRHIFLLLVAVLCVGGLTLYWQWPEPAPVARFTAPQPTPVASVDSLPSPLLASAAPAAALAPAAAQLPGLQGTEVDGELGSDSAGNLRLNLGVRDYFDYFLSAADSAGLDAAVEAMLADASQRLAEPALGQFIGLLGDYMDYKRASLALLEQPLSAAEQAQPQSQLAALQQAFDKLAELRRGHFSTAAVEALFGAEEAYARYTLENLALLTREDLGEEGKAQAQLRLREQLPAAMRASEERHSQAQAQQARSEQLWQEGASEEQVRQFLALTYDPPTVERLLTEQRNERAWQQRYGQYQEELASLQGNGLSPADRQREQQRLRQRLFSAEDQHRVETYDAIAGKQQDSETSGL